MPTSILVVLFVISIFTPREMLLAGPCTNWKAVMGEARLRELPQGKTLIIESLANQTGLAEDDWLRDGVRDFLADLLRSSLKLRPLAGVTAEVAGSISADYRLRGSFQRSPEKLRIFLALHGKGGDLQKQFALAIPYPHHRDFFVALAATATELMAFLEVDHDASLLDAVRDATSSVAAFEAYARGRQLFETYDLARLDEALLLFQKAKAVDFRSPLGYRGAVDLLTFQGIATKQLHKPFSSFFERAEQELATMQQLVKPALVVPLLKPPKKPTKKEIPEFKLENRFLLGHASFVRGLHEVNQGKQNDALRAFEVSVEYVPEDAIAWLQVANLSEKRGKQGKAKEARENARKIAPCLVGE